MTLTMYERIGHAGRRPSPFSWRIRYAFAHKGVEPEFRHVRFADVETIRALSGQAGAVWRERSTIGPTSRSAPRSAA